MLDLGGVRDSAEFTRRLAITAALLAVYRFGAQIPLPGIDSEALAQLGGTAVERISIFALGITPFITILILAELLKVLAPGVRRWEQAEPRNRTRLNRIVFGLALLAAAAQASGLALALEDVRSLVDEPGTQFRLTCIATLVGGVAIVIWLADQITRHGLGCGVWLVFLTPWLAEVPSRIAALAMSWPSWGPAVSVQLLIGGTLAVLVLAAIVGLIRAGGTSLEMAATCLWSVLLADAAWPWLLLAIAALLGGGSLAGLAWLGPGHPLALLALAGLVALFTHLYLRSQRMAGVASFSAIAPALVAVALAAIALADMVLATQLGFVPLAGHLILVAVVALSLLAQWWQPPFAKSPSVETHDTPA